MLVWAIQFNGKNKKKKRNKINKPGAMQNKIFGRTNVAQL